MNGLPPEPEPAWPPANAPRRPRAVAPARRSGGSLRLGTATQWRHAFLLFMGTLLFFATTNLTKDDVGKGDQQTGPAAVAKLAFRVGPMLVFPPLLLLIDRYRLGQMALRRLFTWPAGAITLYIVAAQIGAAMSSFKMVGLYKGYEAAVMLYAASVITTHADRNGRASPLHYFTGLCAVLAIYSLVLAVLFPNIGFGLGTKASLPILLCGFPFIRQNYLAFIALFGLIGLISQDTYDLRIRVGRMLCVGLICVALLLCQTRSVLAGAAVIMTCYVALWAISRSGVQQRRKLALYLGGCVLALSLLVITGITQFETLLEYALRGQDQAQLEELSGRTTLWEIGIEEFKAHPYVGSGISVAVREISQKAVYLNMLAQVDDKWLEMTPNLHSSVLESLLNAGTIGALPMLVCILVWFPLKSLKAFLIPHPTAAVAAGLGLALALESLVVSGLSQASISYMMLCLLFVYWTPIRSGSSSLWRAMPRVRFHSTRPGRTGAPRPPLSGVRPGGTR